MPEVVGTKIGIDVDPSPDLALKSFSVRYGPVIACREIALSVYPGEFVVVLGNNGAGKSSLLKGIMRLAQASGTATYCGKRELLEVAPHRLTGIGIGFVPEGRQVFESLTVEENLFVGANCVPRGRRRESVDQILNRFPILSRRIDQRAGTLSGGEQEILALARALVSGPRLCLLDEPSLGLAPRLVEEIFFQLKELASEGMSLLVAEQLAAVALGVADRGYVLEHGQVGIEGSAKDLLLNPSVRERYLGVTGRL
jgi:branched-chain amino acid transport system ATP-binding protein